MELILETPKDIANSVAADFKKLRKKKYVNRPKTSKRK